jgi:hypothetical protein
MKYALLMAVCLLCIVGCNSSQSPETEKYQGRKETKKLEGASAVGYDGTAIRKSVDKTLNKTDDRGQEMDKSLKAGGEGQK